MRSSSSELLLDEKEELRKRKLKELNSARKGRIDERTCRQRARFYTTALLTVFAMSSGSSLLFLVPLYVDPAISTLVANFVSQPVTCVTTRREDLTGLLNCSWSSCREGCTSDMYHCTHIYVSYNSSSSSTTATTTNSGTTDATTSGPLTENITNETSEAVLLVNIKGCGYPPDVLCKNFTDAYGTEGTEFPCYHSLENRTLVLIHYNRDEQVAIIIHYFAVPFVITLATSVALCVMHCDCRCQVATRHKRDARRPRIRDFSDTSISTAVDLLTTHGCQNIAASADLMAFQPM